MFLSVFEIFKVGLGPSSSHTMGPMIAARRFCSRLRAGEGDRSLCAPVARVSCSLYGSLAFTGRGHGTDRAVILGLLGETPEGIDPDSVAAKLEQVADTKILQLPELRKISFDPDTDLHFDFGPALSGHANGMKFYAYDGSGNPIAEQVYYSIGGGFVLTEEELAHLEAHQDEQIFSSRVRYPFSNSKEMLEMGESSGLSIADMKRKNELCGMDEQDLDSGLDRLWESMNSCINRGLQVSGILPGGLEIRRRASEIYTRLRNEGKSGSGVFPGHQAVEWLGVYAMAVNEENAAGGKVVTAPTNGAAGVLPATLRYYLDFCTGANVDGIRQFLLTSAAIGGIIKHNASISGAEVGCQGEVGSASAMAAAGLCAVLGGSNAQVENAAEIALEHHLGMICDPVKGLVQVPCIERNALGAVKAFSAAALALRGDGNHFVSLDSCIETMRQVGADMNDRYKETSKGGLAVNTVEC